MRSGMSERHDSTGHRPEAGTYDIRLTGHLDARWATRFDGLVLRHEADGTTVLSGPIADQAALHGLLQRVRDLGIPLVSVTRTGSDQPNTPGPSAGRSR
jgi:hypothetical protein